MPDLLASFQINASLPGLVPVVPLRAAPVTLPGAAQIVDDFGAALSGLLIPGAPAEIKGERQADAESGKDLPAEDAAPIDPTLAWLPNAMVPIALPAELAVGEIAASPLTGHGPLPALATASDIALTATPASAQAAASASPSIAAPAVPAEPAAPSARQINAMGGIEIQFGSDADRSIVDAAPRDADAAIGRARFEATSRAVAQPQVPAAIALQPSVTPAALVSGVAAQVFASALTNTSIDSSPLDRANDAAILFHGHARTEQQSVVQAMSATSQAPLDLSQDDWMGQMIDRIAALRDAAEATDTRIKLAPENLGALEVSIRRDGDRLHVHFTADNPAARQLIAEAAPRLAELADARGVKLGQTSVDGGDARHGQQQREPHQAATPQRNATAQRSHEPIAEDRIA